PACRPNMSSVTPRTPHGSCRFGSPKSRAFSLNMGSTSTRFLFAARRLWSLAWPLAAFISGRTGGSAILAAVSAGRDFKIVSTFNSRNTYDLVVRPNIKRAEDLRGKTFAVTSIGGTSWMGILLWLEYLGLDQQRDNIRMQVIGDQAVQVQCVENGLCD